MATTRRGQGFSGRRDGEGKVLGSFGEVAAAMRAGALLKIADWIYLAPGADDDATERLRGLPSPFTLSQARQAMAPPAASSSH
jgi:hypothetical protein